MLRGIGSRFYVEAGFLIVVAALLAVQRVGPMEIVVVMLVAYLAVVSTELLLARRRGPAVVPVRPVEASAPLADEPEAAVASAIVAVHPVEPEQTEAVEESRAAEATETEWVDDPPRPPVVLSQEQPAAPVSETEPKSEPEPEAPVGPTVLVAVPEPEPVVVAAAFPQEPRAWNLWELERLVRSRAGDDPPRDEEWGFLLVYLRDFASPAGLLPEDFDALVRESFGDVLEAAAAR